MIFKKKKLCIFKLNEYNFGLYPDLGGKKILKDYFHKISFLKESGSTSIWVKLLNLELCKLKKTLYNLYNWFSCWANNLNNKLFFKRIKDKVQLKKNSDWIKGISNGLQNIQFHHLQTKDNTSLLNVYNRHLAHLTFHDSNSIVIQSPQKNQGTPTTSDDVDVYKGCIICDADSFLYYNSFFLYKLYIIPYNHETATD
ncbi:unnamed protein product [Rhizophagus irregularis]|nr:unnamed protein product [Rhizophagus irregularis]